MRQRLTSATGGERHLIDRHVVVHIDTEDTHLVAVTDFTLPAGVIFRTDRHVRIAAWSALGSECQSLGTAGGDDCLKLACERSGLGEFESADFIAARCC